MLFLSLLHIQLVMLNKFIFYNLNEPHSTLFEEEASIDVGKNKNNLLSSKQLGTSSRTELSLFWTDPKMNPSGLSSNT